MNKAGRMTDQVELLRQEVILDSIADGVFTVDPQWRITSFNRAAEQITGVPRERAIGQFCFDVFQASICQTRCALRDTLDTGRCWVDQRIDILNSRGEQVPISISTSVLRDASGQALGGVETFRDLSALEMLRREINQQYTFHDVVSKNHRMCRMLQTLPDLAAVDSTVLIEGPTGSGKELVARAIHNLSPRAKRPYVAVNCGALPATLLESELFGYRKGAFTDAKRDQPGRFARAEGGTLFLDEVSDISTVLQVKLLRVLQEREYEPLGATAAVRSNVRIVAATNKPLAQQVAQGLFREDLYYRLNVVRITLPPLAERREDIPLLVNHFLRQLNAEYGRRVEQLSPEAMGVLMRHNFPGNVRELRNIVERAVVLSRSSTIEREHLPTELLEEVAVAGEPTVGVADNPLRESEAATIVRVLRQQAGHRGKAAAMLGIDKSTLWRKMKRLRISFP
jgi:PAS domain S-box-containing protein